ncbi:FecR family protein [Phyllobacterium sp. SB3]|uniref:FecR family protein n=1 Tax=Phyllobacterium sp. SB3 TaxID=3156073 RepID=UPI0032AF0887
MNTLCDEDSKRERSVETSEALKQQAIGFIIRITSGDATTEDADRLAEWRALSAEHEQAFYETASLWKNLGPALSVEPENVPANLSRRGFIVGGSIAASLAGCGIVLSDLGYIASLGAMFSDYATAVGEQRSVKLPDGSTAVLDGGTILSLSYSDEIRQARLVSGAAVFDIAKDVRRPFELLASNGSVAMTEASFAIRKGVDDVSVDCLKGSLHVDCSSSVQLTAGEGVNYTANGLKPKSAIDLDTAAAWRDRLLIFQDQSLENVVADLNRNRRGKILIARNELRTRHVSGIFHLDQPHEIISQLEETLQLHPVNLGGGIVLLL